MTEVPYRELLQRLIIWLTEPLSEVNREYRIDALAKAFMLGRHFIARFALPDYDPMIHGSGPGRYLLLEMLEWCDQHPNCGLNDPPDTWTHWHNIHIE